MERARANPYVTMPQCFLERTMSIALAAVVALSGAPAYAQSAVSLEWTAPADCRSGEDVELEVSRLLGGQPVAPEKRVRARARIEHAPDGAWRVDLVTERGGTRGERTLSAASCHAAADATALILALTIDATKVAASRAAASPGPAPAPPTEPPIAEAPPPAPPPVASPPVASPPATASPPAPERATREAAPKKEAASVVALGAFGAADVGALPVAAAGFGALVAWTPGRMRIEAQGADYPSATVRLPGARGGTFHLATGALRGCYAVTVHSPFSASPCVGFEAGVIGGEGFGVTTPGSGSAFWAASTVGGLFTYRIAPMIALRLEANLSVAMARPRFVFDNAGFVHRPSALGGHASLGMEVRF